MHRTPTNWLLNQPTGCCCLPAYLLTWSLAHLVSLKDRRSTVNHYLRMSEYERAKANEHVTYGY